MTTPAHALKIDDIIVDVVRKDIKNLHLAVYPPEGRVRVAAPLRLDDEAVRLAVITKLAWIKRQQARLLGQERQSAREYVSGESHYFQGHRYLLNVLYHHGPPEVTIRDKTTLDLLVRTGSTRDQRETVLLAWYRQELKELIAPLVAKWEPIIGVEVAEWRVRRMRTRWGTCNTKARRIWLNLELTKKSPHCLEYVVVHEMVHLLERQHNAHFVAHMDRFIPQWKLIREELNRAPLGHPTWDH